MVPVRTSTTFKGDDWIGLKMRDVSVVRGIGVLPVFAGLIGLLLLVGSLAATWAGKAADYSSQSGRINPDTPSKRRLQVRPPEAAPGSTGPGIFTWPFGIRLKPDLA